MIEKAEATAFSCGNEARDTYLKTQASPTCEEVFHQYTCSVPSMESEQPGGIHVRALLTDLFVIGEVLRTRQVPAQEVSNAD